MKVLHIVKTSEGATWAFNLAKRLKELGIEIVCMLPTENGKMVEAYKKLNIDVIIFDASLPLTKPWLFIENCKKFRKIILTIRPDIIHCHFVTNALFLRIALRNFKIPKVFQVPGPLHLEKKFYKYLEIKSANNYDYWIPTCNLSYNIYVKSKVNPNNIKLIYYGGYGGDAINEYKENKFKLHNEFMIDKNIKLIGMVSYFYKPSILKGQIRGIKGHEDFIDAMKIVMENHKDVLPIIIGGAWGKSKNYEKKVKKYAYKVLGENVIFTGYRRDLIDIYKELTIAVHPSHSENLGGAAESLAAAVPTIATNIGGFPDIVKNNDTGLLFEKGNVCDLSKKICYILDNYEEALNMADRGSKLVGNILDINKTAKDVLGYYNYILKSICEKC